MSSPIPSTVSAYLGDEDLTSLSDDFASLYANFELKIATQPPGKTVYQRILKPFPSVVLTPKVATDDEGPVLLAALANAAASSGSGNTTRKDGSTTAAVSQQQFLNSAQHAGLFVEASLVRSDTGAPVAKCLDGNSMTRFERSSWNGGVLTATFKKLKILSTSQQLQGALLRLKFTLKKYTGASFTTVNIPNRSVLSQPIEVFSHSQYLHKKKEKRSKSDKADKHSSDEEDNMQQGREKARKIEHDSVHVNLIAAIKAFKEQGGTKEMLVKCIDACYSDEDSARRHSSPSSFSQWEITIEDPARNHQQKQYPQRTIHREPPQHFASALPTRNNHHHHHHHNGWQAQREAAAAIAICTTTTTTTTSSSNDRRQAKGQESPVRSPQPQCLPPLRQELGAVLQATAQQSPQPSRPMPEVAAYQERSLRGSLPDTPYHHHHNSSASNNGYHSAVPSQARHSSPSSSPLQATPPPPRQPSNILPSLSSLLLLPSLPSPMPAAQQPAPSHSYRPLAPATNDYHDMGNKRKREHWQSPAQPCTFV